MVENTIGRIYLDNNPYADEIKASMKYLVEPSEPTPKDAILKLEDLTEYKMIDNACGSGHILIEGFKLFYRMYMYEGYSSRAAIENILQKNIIGLDLDTRAKQLATFALLMTAAQTDKSFLDCRVMPRVLDFPEPFSYPGGDMGDFFSHYYLGCSEKVKKESIAAFELLKNADSLGSIMKFEISMETRKAMEKSTIEWENQEHLSPYIEAAIPSIKVVLALTDKYTAAVMNPPYMSSASMDDCIKGYVGDYYSAGRADLFSVFMLVGMNLLCAGGKMGMINMQSWMFLTYFEDLRNLFLNQYCLDSLLHLGPRTFDELSGEVVQNSSFIVSNIHPSSQTAAFYYRLVKGKNCSEKEDLFLNHTKPIYVSQSDFKIIPGTPIGYWHSEKFLRLFEKEKISDRNYPKTGITTGDNTIFLRLWHEVNNHKIGTKWFYMNKGGGYRKWYGNNEYVIDYEDNGRKVKDFPGSTIRNEDYFFKEGVTWPKICSGKLSARYSPNTHMFDAVGLTCFAGPGISLYYLMALLCSHYASEVAAFLNPTMSYTVGTIADIPFIYRNNDAIETLSRDNKVIAEQDWDAHETSWDFKVNELVRIYNGENSGEGLFINSNRLEDIVTLYKEHWTSQFMKLHANEEELNRQFIEIYGLQDELTPDVPFDEITILQNGEISIGNNHIIWHNDVLIKQLISYAIGCCMGRYRLDKEGLYIAHYPKDGEVYTYDYNGYKFEIDDDAIVPLMGKDNPFEDDNALQKVINFMKYVFGGDSFLTANMNFIEHCLGKSLEDYLVKDFWKDHKKMYQNRPIYWLFSSKKGAFQVITYMHRMNPYTVERIRTKYLLPYIEYLKGKIEVDEARGADLSTVERKNLQKMKTALEECNEYHDRLHEVAIKSIDFDLDDGVVVNYAKFGDVLAKIK